MGKINNVLIMNSPHVPSYFNAGHRLIIFEAGAYLRKHHSINAECIDSAALNVTWKELGDKIFSGSYNLIVIMLDFDGADNFQRLLYYIRQLSPKSKILSAGRLCKQIPKFFRKFDIDAIAASGDEEAAISSYVSYLNDENQIPFGCHIKKDSQWREYEGRFLPPQEWEFPDIHEIPYEAYSRLYINDSNKFCGIPNKKELAVRVSKGCPIGCEFCDVPFMQGRTDRRINAEKLHRYILYALCESGFDYVSMYSPIFTLNSAWTEKFCNVIRSGGRKFFWKCVTTIEHLSPDIVAIMSEAGCIRISIGVESISYTLPDSILPNCKKHVIPRLKLIAEACQKYGTELNCFVMLGLPGVSLSDTLRTIDLLTKYNARIRPTVYTPYAKMNDSMKPEELSTYNRQLFNESFTADENERRELLRIIYGGVLRNTTIEERF